MASAPPPSNLTSFAPVEPEAFIIRERTFFLGQIFNGIGYGVVIALTFQCLLLLAKPKSIKQNWFMLLYTCILFLFGTLYLAGCAVLSTRAFVDNRNFPGGPLAFVVNEFAFPAVTMGNAVFPMQSWFSDALFIWRCLLIYGYNYYVIIFPTLLLLASFTMGVIVLNVEARPNSGFWSKTSVNFAIPYFSLTISLNILVTLLIVGRLLLIRNRNKNYLGKNHTKPYTSVSSMLIESAALNCCTSIVFLVPYAIGHPSANIFQGLVCYNQIIASLLIVLRVAQGRAWSKDTTVAGQKMTSMRFAVPQKGSTMSSSQGIGAGTGGGTGVTSTTLPRTTTYGKDVDYELGSLPSGKHSNSDL